MSIAIDEFNIPRPVPTAPTPVLERTQTNLLVNLIIVVPATDWAMFARGAGAGAGGVSVGVGAIATAVAAFRNLPQHPFALSIRAADVSKGYPNPPHAVAVVVVV